MPISTIGSDGLASSAVTRPKIGYAGAVLQVVSSTLTTMVTGSADTWTDVISLSITPTSSTSKILILYSINFAALNDEVLSRVLRNGSTFSGYSGGDVSYSGWTMGSQAASNYVWSGQSASSQYLDSPATTSSVTYKLQGYQNILTLYVNRSSGTNSGDSQGGMTTFTLMEISA
jgi:hypothetical protein